MFEYQTAICELTGLPVSNASVYEGPSARRRRRLAGASCTPSSTRFLVSARRAPALARDARDDRRGLGHDDRGRSRSRDGARRSSREVGDDVAAVFLGQPELPRRGRGPRGADRRRPRGRRAADRPGRPADARRAAPARRLRRRRRRGRGPDARQPARLRRPVVRLLRRPGGLPAPHAGPHRRARRPTSTAAAASCSRCRRASSTSAARRRRTTSAPRRRSTRSRA